MQHCSSVDIKSTSYKNPYNGISNNPSESFNAILHRLQKWKQVPSDVITVSLYDMSSYYHREITRLLHQCGMWELKDGFDFLKREPAMMPHLTPTGTLRT